MDIAEKLTEKAKVVSDEIKTRVSLYIEFLDTIAGVGKNLSLDTDRGLIKIREDFINDYLKEISVEDKGLRSIKVSCKEKNASFIIELKKYLFKGEIEIPFTIERFVFNKEERTITFKFGDKVVKKLGNYHSRVMFWFVSSILSIFYRNGKIFRNNLFCQNSFEINHDGTYTIDLNKIPELKELFEKNIANIKYFDFIAIDKLLFRNGLVVLGLSQKLATVMRTSTGIISTLPIGRLIMPLVNRF